VLLEAERLNDPSANALLKSIEEPPPRTVVIVVTDSADALPITIRSRCARIDFGGLSEDLVVEALRADGVAPDAARLAATLAGGRLDRARALAGPLAPLRLAFADVPARITGHGARVLTLTEGLVAALDDAVAALEAAQTRELEEADADSERLGYTTRTAQAMRRRLAEAQKRSLRRARTEALLEGIAAIESVYLDALATGAPVRNLDRAPLAVGPRDAAGALEVCAATRRAFTFNPTEALLLEHLLLHLPATAAA
jgi:DNA polymerase-3 subunit delta'